MALAQDIGAWADDAESLREARGEFVRRIRSRAAELQEAVFAYVHETAPAVEIDGDPQQEAGLREMIAAYIDDGLESFEQGRPCLESVPPAVTMQVRRAIARGISLTTALRRCVAGHTCAWTLILDEANRAGLSDEQRHMLLVQASATTSSMLELLQIEVTNAHIHEIKRRARSREQRRADIVHKLLDGVSPNAHELSELDYELDAWHLAVIATGANARKAVRHLEAGLGCELLLVACGEQTVWAWLGAQRRLALAGIEGIVSGQDLADVSLAVGELREGLEGWRQTHREAEGAAQVARCRPSGNFTRYVDVAPEAAALQDEALANSLIERYLSPLDDTSIGGQKARRALRALFDTEHNVSSAAHALNVDRSTLHRWRNQIEERLGYRLREYQSNIEIALRVENLRGPTLPDGEH